MTDKDKFYLRMAYANAVESIDPSTQNGAVLYWPNGDHMPIGDCNRPPERIAVTAEQLADRDYKLRVMEHAERNAIYAAAWYGVSVCDATMYACWASCAECARAIICSGIRELVAHKNLAQDERPEWSASIAAGDAMMKKAGVIVRRVEGFLGVRIRFGGKEIEV